MMTQCHRFLFALALFPAALIASAPASAQWLDVDPYNNAFFAEITWRDINMRTERMAAERKRNRTTAPKTTPRKAAPPETPVRQNAAPRPLAAASANLNFAPTLALAQSPGIRSLVALHRKDQQATVKSQYVTMISSFNDSVPRLYGVKKNNLATGMAALLTGAYVAYHNRPFPDALVKPLVTQLEAALGEDANLTGKPAAEKERAYHIMVGVGMGLQVAQAEAAKSTDPRAAAKLKQLGADLFRQLHIQNPDSVQFTNAGMSLR